MHNGIGIVIFTCPSIIYIELYVIGKKSMYFGMKLVINY